MLNLKKFCCGSEDDINSIFMKNDLTSFFLFQHWMDFLNYDVLLADPPHPTTHTQILSNIQE